MTNRSDRQRPIAGIRHRLLRAGALGAFLVGTLAVVFGTPIAVSAATSTSVGSSSEPRAFQHSAADKVAYLHDGSLIVGYYDGSNNAIVNHVTNPTTTPVSTQVNSISNGSEITFYTLPGTGSTEIWIAVGSELTGGTFQEQVQYGQYNGTTFTWQTVTTVPGSLTSGRQNPSVTWTGKWLIDSWWDDTLGGNTDAIFYNWTTDPTGTTGWHVTEKSGTTTTAATIKSGTSSPVTTAGATAIDYNPVLGGVPVTNDLIQFGRGTPNSEIRPVTVGAQKTGTIAAAAPGALSVSYTVVGGGLPAVGDVFTFGADVRTVTAASGGTPDVLTVASLTNAHLAGEAATGPYTLNVAALSNPHAVGENDATAASNVGATSVLYTDTASNPPLAGDMFQIGTAISNDGSVTCSNPPPPLTSPLCDAEFRNVTAVSGIAPTYTLTVAALGNAHAVGEPIRIAANQLTSTHSNSVQVAIRHSTKLGATIAVYGAACKILTRTLLDTATDPTSLLGNWSAERTVDANDDCENNFGGPQIAIDESNGNIHVFKAVTAGQTPSWTGVTYWLGHMGSGGIITWGARVVIDPTAASGGASYCQSLCNPPDIAGAVDSTGKVYVFWATNEIGGAIKFATLQSPYTTPSAVATVATTGANPRYPHVPAQAPLSGGYVPLFYQSGSGTYNIMMTTLDIAPPSVPAGLAGSTTTKNQVSLSWSASTDNVGVTGYTIYRNGTALTTVSGTTLTYADTTVHDLTSYTYSVDAFDAASNHSAQSPTIPVATPDWTAPTVPTGLTAHFVSTPEVDLSWTGSTDNVAVTGYTIYRGGTALTTVSGTTTSYADKAITVPANYSYTVDAFDAAGNHSAQSTAATVGTVDSVPPSVPTGVTASATSTQATVTWNASTDNVGVTGYRVYRNGTLLNTVSGSTLSYADTTIAGLTTYSYTVDAGDAAGNHSAQSAAAVVTTVACAGPTLFATYFTWFDNASPGMLNDNVHLLNSGGTTSTGCVTVGSISVPFSLAAGQETHVTFPAGTIGGPVVIAVNSGPAVLASQRVQYYKSFNEVWAMSPAQAATTSYFNWFDKASTGMLNDNIHIVNPGTTTATGIVSLSGASPLSFSLAAGMETFVSFPQGTIGGPVVVTVTSGPAVLASQRVQYFQTFNEVEAMTAAQAASTSYFNWFDKASTGMFNDNIHLVNPGTILATGSVSIPGGPSINFSVAGGAETYVSFPAGTIGGPVIVSSPVPVLASQRVQYYQSFNEVASSATAKAATTSYLMWFDKASPGMVNDNIHIVNPGGSSTNVTVTFAGANAITVTVAAGAEVYVSAPSGALGGPVTISSALPVLAAQRVQYYQTFNEVSSSS
jgi:chitodextrinase